VATFRVQMRDGTVREFIDRGRAGGSYSQSIRYETGFVVIVDCYNGETSIPAADIKEIRKDGESCW
jgi:hypothetical protein